MTILTDAARAVRDAGLIHLPRHAAESSDDLDRPEGAPGGPCEACGSETWPKQPYVATGVYSPYALCADQKACEDRRKASRAQGEAPAAAEASEDKRTATMLQPVDIAELDEEDSSEDEGALDDAGGRS